MVIFSKIIFREKKEVTFILFSGKKNLWAVFGFHNKGFKRNLCLVLTSLLILCIVSFSNLETYENEMLMLRDK